MLLYCVSLLSDSIIDEQDEKIVKILKVAFGPDIWRHAVLVMTFANMVKGNLEEGQHLAIYCKITPRSLNQFFKVI